MVFAAIYVVVMVAFVAAVCPGTKSGKFQRFIKEHPNVPKILMLGDIVLMGCFLFPISSETFPLDFEKAYLLVTNYGAMAWVLAVIYGAGRERWMYVAILLFTVAGMSCRYLLEYGEVSNTYNFTLFNIVSYLALIPAGTVILYHFIARSLRNQKI